MYINIHSEAYPNGEQRGQVYLPYVQYAIPLDGTQNSGVDSENLGIALVSISNDQSQIDCWVVSTIDDVDIVGVHIHGPAAVGVTASPIVFLEFAQISQNYNVAFGKGNATYLTSGDLYINVHSSTYPDGEIRGQLTGLGTVAGSTGANSSDACVSSISYFGVLVIVLLCFIF